MSARDHALRGARLAALKWLVSVSAFALIYSAETLRHGPLAGWVSMAQGNLVIGALVFAGVLAFTQVVFTLIGRMQAQLEQRNAELEAAARVAAAVSDSLELVEVLGRAVASVRPLFAVEAAWIHLPAAADRPAVTVDGTIARRRLGVFEQAQVDAVLATGTSRAGRDGTLYVPLRVRGRAVGVLGLGPAAPVNRSPADLRVLGAIGDTLGVAIENARLHGRVRELAITEERERLSREMHDGFAQFLAYLLVGLDTATDLVGRGRPGAARAELERLRRSAEQAYAEVRDAIAGLRTRIDGDRGLLGALRDELAGFEERTGVRAELETDGEPALGRLASLQALRIVQEALTNARKHATASRVTVSARTVGGAWELAIADDGRGFDPAATLSAEGGHFGLLTMRERAESLGGGFAVESRRGGGTRVVVRLPLAEEEAPMTGAGRR